MKWNDVVVYRISPLVGFPALASFHSRVWGCVWGLSDLEQFIVGVGGGAMLSCNVGLIYTTSSSANWVDIRCNKQFIFVDILIAVVLSQTNIWFCKIESKKKILI